MTNSAGEAVIDPASGHFIEVTKQGFRTGQTRIPDLVPPNHDVIMLPPNSIYGRVVDAHEREPRKGVHVLAWEDGPSKTGISEAKATTAKGLAEHLTSTDTDGRFLLENLDAAASYCIAVGGGGYLQSSGKIVAKPSNDGVSIAVSRGYGVEIHLIERNGQPFKTDSFSPGAIRYEAGLLSRTARAYSPQTPSAILAGIDYGVNSIADATWVFLFTEAGDESQLPGYLTVTIPGFELVREDFAAQWIAGPLTDSEVVVHATANGWGQVAVRFRRPGPTGPIVLTFAPAGVLRLSQQGRPPIALGIAEAIGVERVLDGIPFGQYTWRFFSENSDYMFPSEGKQLETINIGNTPQQINVDLPPIGTLVIVIRGKSGELYQGPTALSLGVGASRSPLPEELKGHPAWPAHAMVTDHVSCRQFSEAPYRINGLGTGAYSVQLTYPFTARAQSKDGTVIIEDGKETIVEFVE